MCIVTGDAGRSHCDVGIDRLKIGLVSDLKGADIRPYRSRGHCFQSDTFEFICGAIVRVNRPKAD